VSTKSQPKPEPEHHSEHDVIHFAPFLGFESGGILTSVVSTRTRIQRESRNQKPEGTKDSSDAVFAMHQASVSCTKSEALAFLLGAHHSSHSRTVQISQSSTQRNEYIQAIAIDLHLPRHEDKDDDVSAGRRALPPRWRTRRRCDRLDAGPRLIQRRFSHRPLPRPSRSIFGPCITKHRRQGRITCIEGGIVVGEGGVGNGS
jgi:hypothetical protein